MIRCMEYPELDIQTKTDASYYLRGSTGLAASCISICIKNITVSTESSLEMKAHVRAYVVLGAKPVRAPAMPLAGMDSRQVSCCQVIKIQA